MKHLRVLTGIAEPFAIEADSPYQAIGILKARIDERRHLRKHPLIGMSLVEALDRGTLNFLVFDEGRENILAGEYRGEYQEPASPELVLSFPAHVSFRLQQAARAAIRARES